MIEIVCDWCGKKTEKYQSNVTENNFCSRDCYNSWNSEEKSGDGNPMWNGGKETVSCHNCGSSVEKYDQKVTDHNFCSQNCRLEWFEEEHGDEWPVMEGEENPSWSGGHKDDYGNNWSEQRRTALDTAGYKCELCGQLRDEHYAEYGFDLEVHHQIPLRAFDDPEDANFQNNLVVCCRNCHRTRLERDVVPHNEIRAPA